MLQTPVFACNVFALTREQRARHAQLAARLRSEATRLEDRPDGFAFVLAADAQRALLLAEFVTLERLGCPFLTLAVQFAPNEGPLRLILSGAEGVKPLLVHELSLHTLLPGPAAVQ